MKKIIKITVMLAFIFILVGCKNKKISNMPVNSAQSALTSKGLLRLGKYKELEVTKNHLEVSETDILIEFYSGLEAAAEEVFEESAKLYDFVNVDFVGKIDGAEFAGSSTDPASGGANIFLGSNSFVPGFEEGIIGMKPGETKIITVTFPLEYINELAGKTAEFQIVLNCLKTLPQITDDLIKKYTTYTSIEDYKTAIRTNMEITSNAKIKAQFESDVLDRLIEGCSFDYDILKPQIEKYIESMTKHYMAMAEQYLMDYSQFITTYFGITPEVFNEELPIVAEYNVKLEKVLIEIANTEQLSVSDNEYTDYVNNILITSGYESIEAIEKDYTTEYIKESIMIEKARELVLSTAIAK